MNINILIEIRNLILHLFMGLKSHTIKYPNKYKILELNFEAEA